MGPWLGLSASAGAAAGWWACARARALERACAPWARRFWAVKDVVLFSLRYLVYLQQGMHYM